MTVTIEQLKQLWYSTKVYMRPMGDMQTGIKDWCAKAQELTIEKKAQQICTVCEIGSFMGESMVYICEALRPKIFITIDPYANGYDLFDWASQSDMAEIERIMSCAIDYVQENCGTRVLKIKGTIQNLLDILEYSDIPIDLFYIDGSHNYADVNIDIKSVETYAEMNKGYNTNRNFILAGHDYWKDDIKVALEHHGYTDEQLLQFVDSTWIVKEML